MASEDDDMEEITDRFTAALARRDFGDKAAGAIVTYVMERGSDETRRALERAAVRRISNSLHNIDDHDLRRTVAGFMQTEVIRELDKFAVSERVERLVGELLDEKLEEMVRKAFEQVVETVIQDIKHRITRED